ncbi:hypothetical protein RSAG8_00899, partial [Rhizoctonia solani AG-8 WAC10335]
MGRQLTWCLILAMNKLSASASDLVTKSGGACLVGKRNMLVENAVLLVNPRSCGALIPGLIEKPERIGNSAPTRA